MLGFVVTSLLTFLGVQDTLFRIFRVERPPSYVRRIVTFSMLFFWGPLLVGTAQAGLLVISQSSSAAADLLRQSFVLRSLPGIVTFVGLTMLYWRAAYRRISLRHASVGALVATIALGGLKLAFSIYVEEFTRVQRAVYGTFAIALFFVLSVQLAWWMLLLGAEISSCLPVSAEPEPEEPPIREPDPWIGLAALEALGRPGRPTLATNELANQLDIDPDELEAHLGPLVENGLLEKLGGLSPGFRLALPTRQTRLAAALAAFRRREEEIPGTHTLPGRTAELRLRLRRAIESELATMTVAELLGETPEDTLPIDPEPFGDATVAVPVKDREPDATARRGELAGPKRDG